MSNPWDWLQPELSSLKESGLLRGRRTVSPLPHGRCRIEGTEYWNFSGNDYLGLADDPRISRAVVQAVEESGTGARASPLVIGRTPRHQLLEERLSRFKHADAAVLFPTGYAANVGTITALAGPGDVIYADRLNHASLIDGCRLSQAKFQIYPHADVAALRHELEKGREFQRRWIVTDSLFSMDGDAAPLNELCRLADEFEAFVIVDEAHATGVFGREGTGLVEESGVTCERLVSTGTLSKGTGGQGGFLTGNRALCDWVWNSGRMQLFSTALATPLCAAAIAAIDIIENEPERRQWLLSASQRVREALREQGWQIPQGVIGPIIPILVGDPHSTMQSGASLQEQGILAATIRPPTVPMGTSRLRVSLSYAHGEEGLSALLHAFARLAR